MIDACNEIRELLGLGEGLDAGRQGHLANCIPCSDLQHSFRELEQVLAEPAPLAPLDLASSVVSILREWRRVELRTLRAQAAMTLLAALVLMALGTWGVPIADGTTSFLADAPRALASAQTVFGNLAAQLDSALLATLDAAPSPPILLLIVLAPLLLASNWVVARHPGRLS